MALDDYFCSLMADERLLRAHGFDNWPDEEQLARYLMDTNDKIDALCSSLGIECVRDVRGRWMASPCRGEAAR